MVESLGANPLVARIIACIFLILISQYLSSTVCNGIIDYTNITLAELR
ncbi:MAG: hypothetical protein ACM3XP_06910 [Nitrososphaerales archaeon]